MTQFRTVIYWDSQQLKIIRGNPRIGDKINFSLQKEIQHCPESELTEHIRNAVNKKGLHKDQIVLLLPRSLATMKVIDLPKASEHELKTMVDYQLTKIIPYPKSEIVYDFTVMNSNQPSTLQIRLVYIHRKLLNRYINIIHDAGIIPSKVCLDSEFYSTVFRMKKIALNQTTSLVHIGSYSSDLVVYQSANIIFSRSLPFGTVSLNDNPENVNDFINEMETTFSLAGDQYELRKKPVYILGLSEVHRSIRDAISERFEDKFVLLDFDKSISAENSIDMLSVLWSQDLLTSLNFIPQDIELLYKKTAQKTATRKLSLLITLLILLLSWIFTRDMQFQKNELAEIRQNVEDIKVNALKLDNKRKDIFEIESFWNNRTQAMNILSHVFESTPPEINLKSLSYISGRVTLRGYAPDLSHIFAFSTELKKIELFESIKTHFARQVRIFNKDLAEFHLECVLESSAQRND